MRAANRLKGENSHAALVALENAAIAHYSAGDLATTVEYLQQLLVLLNACYGGGWNDKVLELSLVLASALFDQVRCVIAISREALSSEMLTDRVSQRRVHEAKRLYEECLAHAESLADPLSEAVVRCVEGVGACCFVLGDFSSSESLFSRALRDTLALSSSPVLPEQTLETDRQRAHRNVASVALAKKSARVVQSKLASGLGTDKPVQ